MSGTGSRLRAGGALRWALLWLLLVAPTAYFDATSQPPGGDVQLPGAPTIAVGAVTVLALVARGMLIHSWGRQGAVAAITLAAPAFALLAASTMVVPTPEHFVPYPLIHPVWVGVVFAGLALLPVASEGRQLQREEALN